MTERPSAAGSGRRIVMSVQQALEEAIAAFPGETVVTQAAGRTDAGVHALGQVVSFDLATNRDPFKVREALNYHLKPHPVAVLAAERWGMFSRRAFRRSRHYEYRILNRRARPALDAGGSGMCRCGSMPTLCTKRRSSFSASTISRRSAPPSARRNHRSRRSTGSMSRASSTW
jgi:tRNA pseudouridine(38-40) synthase